ncbi:MAG: peptidylprolyl isomerase [Hyphomicrobiales bacterium]|nr:peptidylprolyl isomerase [Hyphomicrobiales bacterium]
MKIVKALFGAFIIAGVAAVSLPAVAQDDKVLARVGGVDITETDIVTARAEIGSEIASIPLKDRQRVLVEFLIENQLLAAAAEAEKMSETPGFDNRLKYYRRRALRDMYFEKKVRDAVSEDSARKIYDDQVGQLKEETEVNARHILLKTEEDAFEAIERFNRGDDFAALAKELSQGPSKTQGGDLGYFTKGQMVKEFDEVVFKLKKGEVSEPVKTQFGWHVIKLEDKRQKKPPAFDDVKDRIVSALVQQKAQEVMQSLRAKADVEIVDPEIKKAMEKAVRGSFSQ